MTADKLSLSLDAEMCAAVRRSARKSGVDVSAWVADAAQTKLRSEGLAEFFEEWEREHGAFTDEEMARAAASLGLPE